MKKLLLSVLIVLLFSICLCCIFYGIGLFNVPTIYIINENSSRLASQKQVAAETSETQYANAIQSLNNVKIDLEKAKKEYEDVIALTSTEEYASLGELERYRIEFIWIKLGVIAKENNLFAKFNLIPATSETTNSLYDIEFTILGNYIDIIDFIYSIEGDENLRFIVEDVNMISVEVPLEGEDSTTQTNDNTQTTTNNTETTNNNTKKAETTTMVQASFRTKGITILN